MFAFARPSISGYVKANLLSATPSCYDSHDNLSGLKQTSQTETKKGSNVLVQTSDTYVRIFSRNVAFSDRVRPGATEPFFLPAPIPAIARPTARGIAGPDGDGQSWGATLSEPPC
jgi:hypothetical protein